MPDAMEVRSRGIVSRGKNGVRMVPAPELQHAVGSGKCVLDPVHEERRGLSMVHGRHSNNPAKILIVHAHAQTTSADRFVRLDVWMRKVRSAAFNGREFF